MSKVEAIKKNLMDLVGCEVSIEADSGRNKSTEQVGRITNTYPLVFTIEVNFGSDSFGTISYSYTDVLCEKVKITPII